MQFDLSIDGVKYRNNFLLLIDRGRYRHLNPSNRADV
jgi:hypothetical protein